MAGFIVWLGRRGLSGERRRALYHEVDRYLRWLTRAPTPSGPEVYLHQLRQAGYDKTQLILVSDAIRWLRAYIADHRADPRVIP